MIDPEIRQRASALARNLSAAVRRESFREKRGVSPVEETWSASALASQLMQRATWLRGALKSSEARALLGDMRFDSLLSRKWIRIVFDVVHVMQRGDIGQNSPPKEDIEALTKIQQEARKEERKLLWISAEETVGLYHTHARCFTATPPWAELVGALEERSCDGVPGYAFRVDRGTSGTWFTDVLAEAAAKTWRSIVHASPTPSRNAVLDWMARAGEAVVEAPRFLSVSSREQLLDAALSLLDSDSGLGTLDEELHTPLVRIQPPTELAPVVPSVAAIDVFWDDFDELTRKGAFDETRADLMAIVRLILRYDPDGGDAHLRIFALAQLGLAKPYVIYILKLITQENRPEAIAWFLTRSSTSAFGLALLRELRLQEPSMMDDWDSRAVRLQSRRMALLRDALPIYAKAVAIAAASDGATSSDIVSPMLDALRFFARASVKPSASNDARAVQERRFADDAFAALVAALTTAPPLDSRGLPRADGSELLLAEHASTFVDLLGARFPSAEHIECLKVAHEFLRFTRESAAAFSAQPEDRIELLNQKLGALILHRYAAALDIEEGADRFRFFYRNSAFVELPWEETAFALFPSDVLQTWASLAILAAKVQSIALAQDERLAETTLAGCAARGRVHLEVVLRTYVGVRASVTESRAKREAVSAVLIDTIGKLVLAQTDIARGTVDLFDRALSTPTHDEDLGRLITLATKTVESFPKKESERILNAWISRTSAPAVLMDVEKGLITPAHKEEIRKKLAAPGSLASAEEDLWFTTLVDMAHEAAAAKHYELAEGLLIRGDEATDGHPWRSRWEEIAFQSRLLIAYHRERLPEIESLPLPETATGDTEAAKNLQRKLERTRDFYIALSKLATIPDASRDIFARQLKEEPQSATLLINLFAARLRIADAISEPETRRDEFEATLRWWYRARREFPDDAAFDPNGPHNELIALEGAQDDDEFDRRWARLRDPLRRRVDFLATRLENLDRRGLQNERGRVLNEAKDRYGDSLPALLREADMRGPSGTTRGSRKTAESYRLEWFDIIGLPPEELSFVIGPTRSRELAEFLFHIHQSACLQMLTRFTTLASLHSEDKFNDLIISYLHMQLAVFGWTVDGESRAGLSASGKGVGERDWIIRAGTREIAICEAFRLSSINSAYITEHIEKLVKRYNPQGARASVVIVYYEGTRFQTFTGAYRTFIRTLPIAGATLRVAESWLPTGSNRVIGFHVDVDEQGSKTSQDHILLDLGMNAC